MLQNRKRKNIKLTTIEKNQSTIKIKSNLIRDISRKLLNHVKSYNNENNKSFFPVQNDGRLQSDAFFLVFSV